MPVEIWWGEGKATAQPPPPNRRQPDRVKSEEHTHTQRRRLPPCSTTTLLGLRVRGNERNGVFRGQNLLRVRVWDGDAELVVVGTEGVAVRVSGHRESRGGRGRRTSSSNAMHTSTWSSESSPKSFVKDADGDT